jgi:hypothetical protein
LRLTRRGFLFGAAAGSASLGAATFAFGRPAAVEGPTSIVVRAAPIEALSVTDRERRRFGGLFFRSGLELTSGAENFGGLSALWRSTDGRRLVAVADNAQWLTANVETRSGRLAGLADAVLAPILFANGKPLRKTRFYDTEGLAVAGDAAYVGIERHHAVMRFDFSRDGIAARGRRLPLPAEAEHLPGNSGLEALGVAPPRSPLAGALVAIAERSRDGETAPTTGFILTGPRQGSFRVARSDDFDITDLAFLPNGEMLLLERRFSFFGGLAVRLRRVPPDAIRPGAIVDGPAIFESDPSQRIDNMEGLCVHREADEIIVSMVSDDNFSPLQKTLLLEFALAE